MLLDKTVLPAVINLHVSYTLTLRYDMSLVVPLPPLLLPQLLPLLLPPPPLVLLPPPLVLLPLLLPKAVWHSQLSDYATDLWERNRASIPVGSKCFLQSIKIQVTSY
jgi:hypothetical protein